MLDKIYNWCLKYDFQISWFFIGFFTAEFFQDFGRGEWLGVALDLFIVVINYSTVKGKR